MQFLPAKCTYNYWSAPANIAIWVTNREIDFRHTFEHIRRSFCLNFTVAVKMATCDENQHLCVYVIVGTYDHAPMYARYASRELALKRL